MFHEQLSEETKEKTERKYEEIYTKLFEGFYDKGITPGSGKGYLIEYNWAPPIERKEMNWNWKDVFNKPLSISSWRKVVKRFLEKVAEQQLMAWLAMYIILSQE